MAAAPFRLRNARWEGVAHVARVCDELRQSVSRWCRLGQVLAHQLPSGTWRIAVWTRGEQKGWPVDVDDAELVAVNDDDDADEKAA